MLRKILSALAVIALASDTASSTEVLRCNGNRVGQTGENVELIISVPDKLNGSLWHVEEKDRNKVTLLTPLAGMGRVLLTMGTSDFKTPTREYQLAVTNRPGNGAILAGIFFQSLSPHPWIVSADTLLAGKPFWLAGEGRLYFGKCE